MVAYIMPYTISAFGISDTGLVRQNNEDYWASLKKENFFALADGMGGHRAGEIASKEAVKALCQSVKTYLSSNENFSLEEAHGMIQLAIEETNRSIYKMGRSEKDFRGMGTTLCCLYFHPKGLIYGHVGDSRIYRLRQQKLEQLTHDHSLLSELVDLGVLGEHQASEFTYKNIITKAIGTESKVEPSVHIGEFIDQDIYFMCTDGLTDMLNLKEIETIINESQGIDQAGQELVKQAISKGGHDNITIVLTKINETDETKDLSRQ